MATNPYLSKRLVDIGIPMETADMCWSKRQIGDKFEPFLKSYPVLPYNNMIDTPAWSFFALLSLIPSIFEDGVVKMEFNNSKEISVSIIETKQEEFNYIEGFQGEIFETLVKTIEWFKATNRKLSFEKN